jgi:hypothetical protein
MACKKGEIYLPSTSKALNFSTVIQISIVNGDFHMVLLLQTNRQSGLSTLPQSVSNKGDCRIFILL